METDIKNEIITLYLKIVEDKGIIPTYSDFILNSINKDKIKYHFGNIENLHELVHKEYQDQIDKFIVTEHTVFSYVKLKELADHLQTYKRFVVTTVISDKPVHQGFYKSIIRYCEENNAKLICIPALDVANRKTYNNYKFPVELKNEAFIASDTKLNENLFISSVKLSAKHIQPTTGLSRIGQRNGSYIFASPKQFLDFTVNSPDSDDQPHAIMTTGALTEAQYNNGRYMSDRTSYIATNDHVIGALVVEIENDKKFHFRQIQADNEGSFCDLGKMYSPTKTISVSPTLVMGDLHAGDHDETVLEVTKQMIKEIGVKNVFLHDAFSGYSISHYDENSPHKKAKKIIESRSNLYDEICTGAKVFEELLEAMPADGKIFRVKGNHDEWLERYISRAGYVNDVENHYFSLGLAIAYLEDKDPIEYAFRSLEGDKFIEEETLNRIVWLQRNSSVKVAGIELGQHGDKGLNGSRGSLPSIEKAYGEAVVGHSHTGAIFRGVYRVGTSTKLKLDYNDGPSSWTWTHALVYETGHRQLINIFDGKWRI